MRPPATEYVVAPVPIDTEGKVFSVEPREIEHILSGVSGKRDAIARLSPTLHHGLEIGEVIRKLEHGLHQDVEVRPPGRSAPFDVRETQGVRCTAGETAAYCDTTGEQRDAGVDLEITVAGIALDLED